MNSKSPRFVLFAAFLMAAGLLPNNSLALESTGARRLEKDISPITGWDGREYSEPSVAPLEKRLLGISTKSHAWSNWAGNQVADPAQIFTPKNVNDLIAIVAQAKAANKKVRAAATGHSWSSTSVVNQDGYLVNVKSMNKIYQPVQGADGTWTVEVETGVTLQELDDILRKHNPPLAVSSNIVIESVRYGGVMSMGCHGAATNARTMPDLVTQVKIVDSNGTLNTFTKDKDPVEFSAATVNLGLLGIIYSYTMEVEPMFNLKMTDTHSLVDDIFSDPKVGGPKLKSMVLNNDQTQIFYWPFNTPLLGASNDHLWVKQWQRTNLTATDNLLKDGLQDVFETLETSLGSNAYSFMALNPASTPFIVPILYQAVSRDTSVVLHAPNAIHYRAGIEKMPCLDVEMIFKVDSNFENVVKAWRYVIDEIYNYAKVDKYPINLTMEMRFIKASSMLMSPAYDEDPEAIYCTIEVLSAVNTKDFSDFSIKMAQYWMDNFQAKPHWAKMWEHVPGIVPYLRQKAGARYDKFEAVRQKYDPNGMFMTGTFAGVLGH
ncbi:hypothetical protein BGZ79_008852 [Entomortierella chlamydospora]|nr:hypothetical protein BGZ79_008852 [Entomortierella chlamydospora]